MVDPIDGTWNFANGIPLFGIILSVLHFGRPIYGLLYDHVMDDFIEAELGQGTCDFSDAQDRRRSLQTAHPPCEDLTDFCTLWPVAKANDLLAPHLPKFRRILSVLRCSCHEYRILAQGHVVTAYPPFKPMGSRGRCFLSQLAGGVSKCWMIKNTMHGLQMGICAVHRQRKLEHRRRCLRPVLEGMRRNPAPHRMTSCVFCCPQIWKFDVNFTKFSGA